MRGLNTKTFLKNIKLVTGALPNSATPITLEYYITDIKRLRDATSPGPSIVTTAMVKTKSLDPELRQIVCQRFNFSWCTGYYPRRYQRSVDLLIHKEPDVFSPHRLRSILLFGIEANFHKKHLGKLTMRRAEEFGALDPEQYGIRKLKAVYIQALNTQLFYDIKRLKRFPSKINFADLVSNYNLGVHIIASLSLQRENIPKEPIICKFTDLQNTEHSVRTAFGESELTYVGGEWALPLNPPHQGLGKGNRAAPAIW